MTENNKIKTNTVLVELDGDNPARKIWQDIKDNHITPFVDLDIKYFDLCQNNITASDRKVISEAIRTINNYQIGIKCPSIDPIEQERASLKEKKILINNEDAKDEEALRKIWLMALQEIASIENNNELSAFCEKFLV